jgi:hypothetical protein
MMRTGLRLRGLVVAGLVWVGVAGCSGDDDDAGTACPSGHVQKMLCTACAAAGGCARKELKCTRVCKTNPDCEGDFQCVEGACQFVGCI